MKFVLLWSKNNMCCTEIDKCFFTIIFTVICSFLGNLFSHSKLIGYLLLYILCFIVCCFNECDFYTLMSLYSVFQAFFSFLQSCIYVLISFMWDYQLYMHMFDHYLYMQNLIFF